MTTPLKGKSEQQMLEITPIPAFGDNYIWMLRNPGQRKVAVVDPGEGAPVVSKLQEKGLELSAVLLTHHHYDHTGGVAELLNQFPEIAVYGPLTEDIPGVNHPVSDNETIELDGIQGGFLTMEIPGHTAGHVAYYGEGALFAGDTLFSVGCGRVFEGTHHQMAEALQRLLSLPPETLLYCGHEYTLDNIGFAKWVEPENPHVLEREKESRRLRAAGEATIPTTLAQEATFNPFLRLDVPEVIAAAEKFAGHPLTNPLEIFTAIRQWKDEKYD